MTVETPSTAIATLRHPARGASGGLTLIGAGTALGLWVTAWGPQRTGELRLDQLLSVDREWPLVLAARAVDLVLGPLVGPALLLLVALVIARRHRPAALVLAAATITGWLSVGVGKLVFARQRPSTAAVHALIRETGHDSFPSGHTAFAVALVIGAAMALRTAGRPSRPAWLVGIPAAVFVAFTRLYLGAHFLGDVLASFAYVGGSMLLMAAVVTWLLRHVTLPARLDGWLRG